MRIKTKKTRAAAVKENLKAITRALKWTRLYQRERERDRQRDIERDRERAAYVNSNCESLATVIHYTGVTQAEDQLYPCSCVTLQTG